MYLLCVPHATYTHTLHWMCNSGSILCDSQQAVIHQITAASAPVGENQMIVLTRTCDNTTPSAGGYLCQEHHNVKRVPIKAPVSRLHEKISHSVLVKLPGSEKQNCFITEYSACQEENPKIRACQHSAAQTVRYHYILVISVIFITPLYSMKKTSEVLLLLTLRRLMSYIYGAPILDVSRSHTTTQHSR